MPKAAGELSALGRLEEERIYPRVDGRGRSSGVQATPGIHSRGPGWWGAGPGRVPATCVSSSKLHNLPEPVSFPVRRRRLSGTAREPALGEALCTESALITQIPYLGIKITQHPKINSPGAFQLLCGRVRSGRISESPDRGASSRGGTKAPVVVCSVPRFSLLRASLLVAPRLNLGPSAV